MSRGPGRWQRAILDAVSEHGAAVLTREGSAPSDQNAVRRAAYALERAGRVQLTSERVRGRARLVAYPMDAAVPPPLIVTGLDGKTYRRPTFRWSAPQDASEAPRV